MQGLTNLGSNLLAGGNEPFAAPCRDLALHMYLSVDLLIY